MALKKIYRPKEVDQIFGCWEIVHYHLGLHQDKWPLYLRIIDAQEANPIWKVGCPTFEGKLTWEEIGETLLLPDPETVSQEEYDRLLSDKVAEKAQNTWKQAQVVMNNFPTSEVLAA